VCWRAIKTIVFVYLSVYRWLQWILYISITNVLILQEYFCIFKIRRRRQRVRRDDCSIWCVFEENVFYKLFMDINFSIFVCWFGHLTLPFFVVLQSLNLWCRLVVSLYLNITLSIISIFIGFWNCRHINVIYDVYFEKKLFDYSFHWFSCEIWAGQFVYRWVYNYSCGLRHL